MAHGLQFQPIETGSALPEINAKAAQEAAKLWNAACGDHLAISVRFAAYNLRPSPGGEHSVCLALRNNMPIGFVSVSSLNDDTVEPAHSGWIDAIAVAPGEQGKGVGSALLQWADTWHVDRGTTSITVGGSLHPFVPGAPEELNSASFFQHSGYEVSHQVWDVSADLARYKPPQSLREIEGIVRPAQRDDYDALLTFLQREFPDRWRFEFEQTVAEGGRISDYMTLWTERGVDGCCILTFEDSLRPIERFYPYRLPRAWGQLGSIGVSEDRRGRGYGAALLDAGLRRLHNNGVNGCIIDWTSLLDFYGKFGFTPYRTYLMLSKSM